MQIEHIKCKAHTGANSRGTLLEPQKDPSVLEDVERSTTTPASPKTWVHDVFFMEDIYVATFPCHQHSACAQPCLLSPRMRCSSSAGTPGAWRGSSVGQAPDGTCCHAAAGIWEQPSKANVFKVVALPRTWRRSAAPSTPLLFLPKHLVQGETGRIEQQRYQFKVTLWQLTPI